jgi:hypothetical protein
VGVNTDSAAFVYCSSQLTLGLPQYAARLSEATTITSGTGTKMMDLYATSATELEKLVTMNANALPATATGCKDPNTGAQAKMFNADNTCNEAGVTCLQGYQATDDQVNLCSSVVTQAVAQGADPALTLGRRLAIAVVLAGSQMCE